MAMKAIYGIAAALSALLIAPEAVAQANYPDKTIRMLVGFAPAGPADIIARVVGDKLSQAWGQPVVIENVSGAAANLAGDRAAKSAPDGYTLLMASNAQITVNPSLYDKMPYDTVKDLVPITQVVFTPNILAVHNDVPARNVQELAALARAQPGKLTFGSAGVGTSQHLSGELFKSMGRLEMTHIPYRGGAPVVTDLLGERLTMFFGNISVVLPQTREGKLRALAVTSAKRFAATPELPTMAESGFPGFDATASFGLMAPTGTPPAIIDKIHREAVKIMAMADVRKRLDDLGMEVIANSPAEFAAVIKSEIPQWAKVIKEAGIKATD
jgi:tripartite-type tricarboxylate transporter receptor subunit TctC